MILELALGTVGALIAGGAGARIGLSIWRHLESIRTDVAALKTQRLELQERASRDAIHTETERVRLEQSKVDRARLIYPCPETGAYPLIMVDSRTVYDPTLAALADVTGGLHGVDPRLAVPEQKRRLVQAMANMPAPAARAAIEGELDQDAQPWPGSVNLGDLVRRPSLDNLVIGATQDGDAVTLSLHDLMHCLLAGASGWGKSVWLRSFVYQLARAPESVEVIAIDVSGSEFNALANWGRLRWPVAKTPADAIALLGETVKELERRQELYARHPLVTCLQEYNAEVTDPLAPWVILADEGTSLLGDNKGVAGAMKAVLWRARQYGIYAIVAGQTARYDVIPTPLRDQFSTRLAFRLSPTSSRVVLDNRSAADLRVKGRCVAVLTGQEPQELQGPFVTRQQFIDALAGDGPMMTMPEPEPNGHDTDLAERVRAAWQAMDRPTVTGVTRVLFGVDGGRDWQRIKDIVTELGLE